MFFQFRGLRLAEISTLPRSIVREAHEISKELIKQKEVLNMLKIWAWSFNMLCELAAMSVDNFFPFLFLIDVRYSVFIAELQKISY